MRPGDVPERDDTALWQALADSLWREREVVVVDEDEGESPAASSHTASAKRPFTFQYVVKSSGRNTGLMCARWHIGQSASLAKP